MKAKVQYIAYKIYNATRKSKLKEQLTEKQKKLLDQTTFTEAEKVVKKLEEKERDVRSKVIKELKSIFKELPQLILICLCFFEAML